VCIALCTIVAHNIAQNRPDNFPPYPPDNHHNSDDVYLREGGVLLQMGHWDVDDPWEGAPLGVFGRLKSTVKHRIFGVG